MWPQKLKNMIAIGAIMVADRQKLAMIIAPLMLNPFSTSLNEMHLNVVNNIIEHVVGENAKLVPQVLHSLKALSIAVKNTLSQLRLKHEDIEELHTTSKRWATLSYKLSIIVDGRNRVLARIF